MKRLFTCLLTAICLIAVLCNCTRQRCRDGIQNQNETTTDCGGPCKSCGTCFDGVKNQNETGIDCGGVCSPCPSCTDGIKNQDETKADCGGVCGKCPIVFPFNAPNGFNLLRLIENDTNVFTTSGYLFADIPEQTNLVVKLTNMRSETAISWQTGSQINTSWTVSSPNQNVQTFSASGPTIASLLLELKRETKPGSMLIEYYVNNESTPRFIKVVGWRLF